MTQVITPTLLLEKKQPTIRISKIMWKTYALICGRRQKGGDQAHKEERWLSLLFLLPRVPPLPLSKAR